MALYSKVAIDNAISKAMKDNELRPNQLAAITSFVNGREVFVCLPTGTFYLLMNQLVGLYKLEPLPIVFLA